MKSRETIGVGGEKIAHVKLFHGAGVGVERGESLFDGVGHDDPRK
jgi:hypothetical protein